MKAKALFLIATGMALASSSFATKSPDADATQVRMRLVRILNHLAEQNPTTPPNPPGNSQGSPTTAATPVTPVEPTPDPSPEPAPNVTQRDLTEAERVRLRQLITWLGDNGRLAEAQELERLMKEGRLKVEIGRTDGVQAEWRRDFLYINENVLNVTPWSKTGNAKNNARIAETRFEDQVRLAGILVHEMVHQANNETFQGIPYVYEPDELRAYRAQRRWLQEYLLNNPNLTARQQEIVRGLIDEVDAEIQAILNKQSLQESN